ncbi:MAG: ABC transporter permease [Planctomycetes bacterium]|nr:ABC transporter permease [Planctomycetota bacterium]
MSGVVYSSAGLRFSRLLNPWRMARDLFFNRELIFQMAGRDIAARYRSSWFGVLWAVFTPLVMLAIYTFVFAYVLKARWGSRDEEAPGDYALTLFCGMLVFNLFAEVVNRAPSLVVWNANLVKKVVFPLETLVPSAMLGALFTFVIGVGVWLLGWFYVTHLVPPATIFWLPIVLMPLLLTTMGIGWFLASLGVFARDMGQVVQLCTQILFFTTPVFFRLDIIKKEPFRTLIGLNPLTPVVEDARRVMMGEYYWGLVGQAGDTHPAWETWGLNLAASAIVALIGHAFFVKSKRAFSDVL